MDDKWVDREGFLLENEPLLKTVLYKNKVPYRRDERTSLPGMYIVELTWQGTYWQDEVRLQDGTMIYKNGRVLSLHR